MLHGAPAGLCWFGHRGNLVILGPEGLAPACVAALITALERSGERFGAGHESDVADFAVAPPAAGLGSAGLGNLEAEHEVTS